MTRVIVVGAGISGLTAAWRLQCLGHDVRVLESTDHVGGKIAAVERDGFRVGRGAGVYAGSYTAFLALVAELGLGAHITRPATVAGVMRDGRPHWLRGEGLGAVLDFVRTPLISPRSKLLLLRLGIDVLRHRKAISYDDADARAAIDVESVGAYCDRRLNADVTLIERFDTGARVVWTQDASERDERVDGVVVSIAAPQVPPIYPGLEPELQAIMLEGLPPANYAVLRIALNRRPDIDGTFLAVPEGELTGIGTIAFEHNISADVAPPGRGILGIYTYADWFDAHRQLSDDALIDALLPDLDRVIRGIAEMIEFIEITRWTPATLSSEPGIHRRIAQLDAALNDRRRVQHAGDYLSLACIEGSVVAGVTAARRLSAALGS